MGLSGHQRRRRILQGMKPEDGTKPGQITATEYTEGTPDEVQRPDGPPEGKEIPGNQFVDGGESVARQSEGVEIPGGQSADPDAEKPDGQPEPVKTAENLTDLPTEPTGPDAEGPTKPAPETGGAAKKAARNTRRRK